MAERAQERSLFDPKIVRRAVWDSVIKLDPRTLMRNPVMFVVEVVAGVTTILFFRDLLGGVNQRVAAACDTVVLMVAGIPLTIKAPRTGDDVPGRAS